MAHGAPGIGRIGAKVAGAVLAYHKSGGSTGELEVDQAVFVCCRFDGVRRTVLGELN